MDAKIFRINYKSDFILTLTSDAGWMTPFCIKFWTGAPSQAFYAQWDGETYTHCAYDPSEPTKLTVQFDDHHLPIGELQYQVAYHFTVNDFPNDTEDEVLNPGNVTTEIDGEEYQVMLDFTGETAPEIQFSLPAYANEAQRIENEQQRIANEQQRIVNEEARIAAETVRQQNEATRIAQEEARVTEFARLKRESEAATGAANDAATLANQKAQLAADKAALADAAATLAGDKAQLAADKAALAQAAATLANEKAALAQQKATYAQTQGDYAKAQGDYAKEQGDYAKEQGTIAEEDHVRAEADHTRAEQDHTTAANDHTQGASDHTTAASDHTRAESDHTTAASDHTRAESDHTTAASDHTRAESDHTTAASDHTRAESDHTRAESDHAAVEVYVDSLGAFDISSYHATGGVLAKYADLSAALDSNNGGGVPQSLQKGGMSVKFVQSSDNKYVQYMFMLSGSFTTAQFTNITNWQRVDGAYDYTNLLIDKHQFILIGNIDVSQKIKLQKDRKYLLHFSATTWDITSLSNSDYIFYINKIVNGSGSNVYIRYKPDGSIPEYYLLQAEQTDYYTLGFKGDEGTTIYCYITDITDLSYLNVNESFSHPSTFTSKSDARTTVINSMRKLGMVITYLLNDNWYSEQYIGTSLSNWSRSSFWKKIDCENTSYNRKFELIGNTNVSQSFKLLPNRLYRIYFPVTQWKIDTITGSSDLICYINRTYDDNGTIRTENKYIKYRGNYTPSMPSYLDFLTEENEYYTMGFRGDDGEVTYAFFEDITDKYQFINVNEIASHSSTYTSKSDARSAVPESIRKAGCYITYLLNDNWVREQFIGSSTSGTNWTTEESNWKEDAIQYDNNHKIGGIEIDGSEPFATQKELIGYSLLCKYRKSITNTASFNTGRICNTKVSVGDKILWRVKADTNIERSSAIVLSVLNTALNDTKAPHTNIDTNYDISNWFYGETTVNSGTQELEDAVFTIYSETLPQEGMELDVEIYIIRKDNNKYIPDNTESSYFYELIADKPTAYTSSDQSVTSQAVALPTLKKGDDIIVELKTKNNTSSGQTFTILDIGEENSDNLVGYQINIDGVAEKQDYKNGIILGITLTKDIAYGYLSFRQMGGVTHPKIKVWKKTIVTNIKEESNQDVIFETDEILKGMVAKMPFLSGVSMATRVDWTLQQWKGVIDTIAASGMNFLQYFDYVTFNDHTFEYGGKKLNYTTFAHSLSESDFDELVEYATAQGVEFGVAFGYQEWYTIPPSMMVTNSTPKGADFHVQATRDLYCAVIDDLSKRMAAKGVKYFNLCLDEYKGTEYWWAGLVNAKYWGYEIFVNKVTQIVTNNGLIPMCYNGVQCAGNKSYPDFCKQMVIMHYHGDPRYIPSRLGSLETLLENDYNNLINSTWELYFSPYDQQNHEYTQAQLDAFLAKIASFDIRKFHQNNYVGIMPLGVVLSVWPNPLNDAYTSTRYINEVSPLITALGDRLYGTNGVLRPSNRPSSPTVGQQYFDEVLLMPIWWNGHLWIDAKGNEV